MQPSSHGSFIRKVAIGVLLLNLLVAGAMYYFLNTSKQQYEDRAAITTQNFTQVFDESISGVFSKIDISLKAVVDEAERQLSDGAINRDVFNRYIVRQHAQQQELVAFRATNALGDAIYGRQNIQVKTTISLAHRDYFQYLRDSPHAGLVISKPVIGGISGRWMIVLARRFNTPEGRFAGLVYAGLELDYLSKSFARVNVGHHGLVSLLDGDLNVVVRYLGPQSGDTGAGQRVPSQKLLSLIRSGKVAGTYSSKTIADSIERTHSFRKISFPQPYYIVVAQAKQDYLTEWRQEVLVSSLFMKLFSVITILSAWLIQREWRRNETEVAERRRAEAALQMTRVSVDAASDAIFWITPDARFVDINPAACRSLGYTREELLQLAVSDVDTRYSKELWQKHFPEIRSRGTVKLESEHRARDGHTFPVEIVANYVQFGSDEFNCAFVRDITEQKRASLELRQSEERFRSLMALSPDIISILDQNGRLLYNSDAAFTIHGYTQAEMTGRNTFELIHPDDQKKVSDDFEALLAHPQTFVSSQFRYRNKDGSYTWMEYCASNQLSNPLIKGIIAISRDISERKAAEEDRIKLEQQMLHAQKLESLGVLAGGIAHDFNNILTAIIGNAELALIRLPSDSLALENLQRIEKAATRAADLAKQMLAYSGKGKFVVETINLNRLIEEMGHMLEVSISKKTALRYNLAPSLPAVDADATQIRQVIMNLVINASEAIGDHDGVITLRTGCQKLDEHYQQQTWLIDHVPEGRYIVIEVADTGCGMDQETRSKIFDPFFTTKFTGRGLGMAAVMGIIRGHKGTISLHSEPGKGTTFTILLPESENPVETVNTEGYQQDLKGSGKVLLVDDEDIVRHIGSEMLKELGFTPLIAADGREAIEVFGNNSDISCIILDLTMPHMDGEQCLEELRKLDPDIKVIISSGFSEIEISRKFKDKGMAGFIQKPYNLAELQNVMRIVTRYS